MTDKSLVSIIVPCYNQACYLAETLDSVLIQTYQNWECIIVNDGSVDCTDDVALKFVNVDKRFTLISIPNGGLSNARNTGIKASSGEYLLPLDSDDLIAPTYLEYAINAFSKDNSLGIVYGKARMFGKIHKEWKLPVYSLERMLMQNCIYCSAVYTRSLYDKTNGYSVKMKYGLEDWDFWLSMIENGSKILQLDEVLFFYRVRVKSMRSSLDSTKLKYSRVQIWENHKELYSNVYLDPYESAEYLSISESMEYKVGYYVLLPIRKLRSFYRLFFGEN